MNCAAFFNKVKGLADEMAAADKEMPNDDAINAILTGLDSDYVPWRRCRHAWTNKSP